MRVYTVVNQTRGTTVAERVSFADAFFARLRGLLGRRGLAADEGLFLTPCSAIHTLFMAFPIDCAFLAADHGVLRIAADVRPWRLSLVCPGAAGVLELAAGRLAASGTAVGDRLGFMDQGAGFDARTDPC